MLVAAASGMPNLGSLVSKREVELPGVSAPHGPKIGDTGEQRPQWTGPVEWAGVPPA